MTSGCASITLLCPICRAKNTHGAVLAHNEPGSWQCAAGHHFDQAKQGYLNLLPAQFKRSKDPGDSKVMVQARRRFLQAGHYAPIADLLADCIRQSSVTSEYMPRVLDAGCGEGYYLRQLQHALPDGSQLFGNDVSKPAVQAAAPWHKAGHYVVASNARLPYPDASFDVLICAFGFNAEQEFRRVLKPEGVVITLDPSSGHLRALRDVLYDQEKAKPAQTEPRLEGFTLKAEKAIQFSFTLRQAELQNLLSMTPHAHRAPQSGKERLALLDSLKLDAEVIARVWQVNAAADGEANDNAQY